MGMEMRQQIKSVLPGERNITKSGGKYVAILIVWIEKNT